MKKIIYGALALIAIFILVLNSSILADQAVNWVKDNPKDPDAPLVLYRAGRWCNIMGDGDTAIAIYQKLYDQYPEKSDLCAPAMYYSGEIKSDASNIVALRKQAIPYLEIVVNQYSTEGDWGTKAKKLLDEVNYVH